VTVADNRVLAITGDRKHPLSQGFVCPKATDATEFLYHPERVHYPRKRVGNRGAGAWKEISWDQALDEIADQIRSITDRHGPEALGYSFGTFRGGDWAIGERFLNRFGSPNAAGQDKICYGPITLAETLTYGFGPSVFGWPVAGTTRCVVVWGMRPTASGPLLWRAIYRAHKAGATLIVIDPEQTLEARRADIWLQPKPGADAALAIAFLKVIVELDQVDHAFIRDQTIGFDALKAHLARFDLAALADRCGVSVDAIGRVASLIATSGATLINAGNGLCQNGTPALDIGRAIANLIAVTGNLGRAGAHQLAGPPRDIVANGMMLDADHLGPTQRAKRLGGARFAFVGSGYAAADASVARAWFGQRHTMSWMATAHEPSLWRAITEEQPYPLKALIVQHHNPLGANAHARAAARALTSDKLELLVVQDLFETPTSRLADYLLPAAHWLEKPYFSLGIGFLAPAGDFVAANPAALTPTHEHRSDYDFWRDLGRRLGQADAWPERAEDFYSQCLAPAALDFDQVSAARGPLTGAAARHPAHGFDAPPLGFGTPSGKVELASSLLAQWGLNALPCDWQPNVFELAGEFPLILTSGGRTLEGFHENAHLSARFRARNPHPYANLHPETARVAGIADGDWMTIETPLGAVRQVARLTHGLAPGVVRAERWWYPERAADREDPYGLMATNINVCTADDDANSDPVMGAWLLRGLPCRVVKAAPA
jgi:anaerobic selenocysteine-containing dehydrogenase